MKKILLLVFLTFLFLLPQISNAAGLVPCGEEGNPCTFCHLFVLFENIVNFVLFEFVPPLAILMLVVGGAWFFFAAGDPGQLQRAKGILTSVVWGLIIIYGAWLLVNLFFMTIGINEAAFSGLPQNWFKFECPI